VKSFYAVSRYLLKEDKEPLEYGMDGVAEALARSGHRKVIGKRLLTEDLRSVTEAEP
jgi:hypothetical protein